MFDDGDEMDTQPFYLGFGGLRICLALKFHHLVFVVVVYRTLNGQERVAENVVLFCSA